MSAYRWLEMLGLHVAETMIKRLLRRGGVVVCRLACWAFKLTASGWRPGLCRRVGLDKKTYLQIVSLHPGI